LAKNYNYSFSQIKFMEPKNIFKQVRKDKRKALTEQEAREVLKFYKIPVVKGKVAKTIGQAKEFADDMGYPLVLKIVSKDVLHKTDVGGVVVNVRNEAELKNSFFQILKNVHEKKPRSKIDGIFVQKMLAKSPEVIVGGKWDQTFEQVILFGLGGVFVEVFNDVSFRVVPIKERDAVEMIEETKGLKILKGCRGQKPVDFKALIDILMKTSKMLEQNQEIKELDINPIFAMSNKAVAVDARIIIE